MEGPANNILAAHSGLSFYANSIGTSVPALLSGSPSHETASSRLSGNNTWGSYAGDSGLVAHNSCSMASYGNLSLGTTFAMNSKAAAFNSAFGSSSDYLSCRQMVNHMSPLNTMPMRNYPPLYGDMYQSHTGYANSGFYPDLTPGIPPYPGRELDCRQPPLESETENLFFDKYGDIFSFKKRPFLSRSETYEASVAKSIKMFQLRKEQNWSDEDFTLSERILNYDFALTLHHTMFIPALERMATDEQKITWLPMALAYQIIGTYAQTELGHGTNLLGLETTATFDKTTDEFVLNTPKLSSIKWWPGGLGKSCTHALVLAQLVIDNTRHGMHAFMVQLRSLEDHSPMPGIKLGDIGPKLGYNNSDNGFMILNNVRVPRFNMMMKNSKVTRDGKFTHLMSNKANYATMILVRAKIICWSADSLTQASCVAVRYSAVRRQTTLKPNTLEQQILDFQTQQYKIFPALAAAYASFFVGRAMMESYNLAYSEITKGNNRKLGELHAQSSGLKAYVSDMSTELVEICRRSCGGHGYLMSSGIAANASSSLALVTVEGENTVLYLQTARYLMKQIAVALSGTKTDGATGYMNQDSSAYICPIKTRADCTNLKKLSEVCTQMAHRLVMSVAQKLQMDMESHQPQDVVFNNNMVSLVRAAKMETLGLAQIEWLRQEELTLLAIIRPNAVGLVDAFDLHDETVASTLGCYDGNAYQHLYDSTQYEPLNSTEVHPVYYKYIRALLKGSTQSKL